MSTVGVEEACGRLDELVHRVLAGDIVTISSEQGDVVMLSEDEWESILETLYLLGDPCFL